MQLYLNQSIEDEDIYEFLHDKERINNITSDEIYEAANKVLKIQLFIY